jgi:hypothetical protein
VGTSSYAIGHLVLVDGEVRVRGTVHRVTVAEGTDGALTPVPAAGTLRRFLIEGS